MMDPRNKGPTLTQSYGSINLRFPAAMRGFTASLDPLAGVNDDHRPLPAVVKKTYEAYTFSDPKSVPLGGFDLVIPGQVQSYIPYHEIISRDVFHAEIRIKTLDREYKLTGVNLDDPAFHAGLKRYAIEFVTQWDVLKPTTLLPGQPCIYSIEIIERKKSSPIQPPATSPKANPPAVRPEPPPLPEKPQPPVETPPYRDTPPQNPTDFIPWAQLCDNVLNQGSEGPVRETGIPPMPITGNDDASDPYRPQEEYEDLGLDDLDARFPPDMIYSDDDIMPHQRSE